MELHWEGSAHAACASGLFSSVKGFLLQEVMDIKLELLDEQSLTLAVLMFTLPFKNRNFRELVIAIKKHFFYRYYNPYKFVGCTSCSRKKFHHFNLISCNNISITGLSEKIPDGHCQIFVTAKAIKDKNCYAIEQEQFNAKFKGLSSTAELIWKKHSINYKTKQNKIKTIEKNVGPKILV